VVTQPLSSNPGLAKIVEKQMRNWELARSQRPTAPQQGETEVEEFVALSRMIGSGGGQIAHALGERLDWPVFDKQILHVMAGDDAIRRHLYESMDERDLSWFEATLRSLLQGKYAKNDYFHTLTETILSVARQGHAVFLGRAADLVLPADTGLRVRIVASPDHCIRQFAERHDITAHESRARFEQIERERTEFIEHHFRTTAADPARHDLIINVQRWSQEDAVELILSALRMRRSAASATSPSPKDPG